MQIHITHEAQARCRHRVVPDVWPGMSVDKGERPPSGSLWFGALTEL
jgi:hypothetical protein